jgi:hypothetical protein
MCLWLLSVQARANAAARSLLLAQQHSVASRRDLDTHVICN